jgi:hypothetical protein
VSVHSKRILEYVSNEVPSGLINGTNTIFVLSNVPVNSSERVSLNGLIQFEGISKDYILSGSTITFTKAPKTNNKIFVSYFK